MARVKVTSSDIYARLARGECANYRNNACQGRTPCTIINGEPCQYFDVYVKPLLDYTEFGNKYAREAKHTLALNPKAKVIRKRRQAAETGKLELEQAAKAAQATPRTPVVKPPAKRTPHGKNQSALPAASPAKPAKPAVAATPAVEPPKKAATAAAQPAPAKAPVAPTPLPPPTRAAKTRVIQGDMPLTTVVSVGGDVHTTPAKVAKKRTPVPPALPSLSLFDVDPTPATSAAKRRR